MTLGHETSDKEIEVNMLHFSCTRCAIPKTLRVGHWLSEDLKEQHGGLASPVMKPVFIFPARSSSWWFQPL